MIGSSNQSGYWRARNDQEIVIAEKGIGFFAEGGVALAVLLNFGVLDRGTPG